MVFLKKTYVSNYCKKTRIRIEIQLSFRNLKAFNKLSKGWGSDKKYVRIQDIVIKQAKRNYNDR